MQRERWRRGWIVVVTALLLWPMVASEALASYAVTVQGVNPVTAIAAGRSHTVALQQDGTLVAWGRNQYGQTTVPAGLAGVAAIAAGEFHTVALKDDGTVVAWGYNSQGQATVPAGLAGVTAIAAGGSHTVALKSDGTVVAWGYNNQGQTTVPAGLAGVTAIAAGDSHTVALQDDGTVVAWGYNNYGQSTVPAGLAGVTAIAASWYHTVALKGDGTVVAWGETSYGLSTVPAGLSGVTAIAAGWWHTVALKDDGTVVAWGYNIYGQSTVPAGLAGVTAIAAGQYHAVALKGDGTMVAWGNNSYGESTVPAAVALAQVTAVAAGEAHTVVLQIDGTVAAWGSNGFGQTTSPVGLARVTAIAAGSYHTVALQNDGTVVAWGNDSSGQRTVPTGLAGVTAIAAGGNQTAAVQNDGTVVAWGSNSFGQSTVPAGLSGVTAVAVSGFHTVALKNNGTVVSWGSNSFGQNTVPAGLTGVVAIAAGGTMLYTIPESDPAAWAHTVALKSDGTVVAWGDNSKGQTTVPAGLSGVVAIAAGRYHAVALKGDGTVVAWGDNSSGQSTVITDNLTDAIAHGTITCDSPVTAGSESLCTISPDAGYGLATFTVNGVDQLANVSNNHYTIANVQADQVVRGSFVFITSVPDAPTIGSATAGHGQATVSFSPPAWDGGLPISGYTVTADPGAMSVSGAQSPLTVSGLTNGTAYTFTVTATNAEGPGAASAPSNPVTPATVPGAPLIGTAVAGNGQAWISFSPPASDGGRAIVGYAVTSSPGGIRASAVASPIAVSGLINGTAYTFTVTATNGVGTGPASAASNSVTPAIVNYGSVIDAPHNASQGVACKDCHSYTLWWQHSPAMASTSPDYAAICNAICAKCHSGMVTHSSVVPGEFALNCLDCHSAHNQAQVDWRETDANELYLVQGTIDGSLVGNAIQTTFSYSLLSAAAEWSDPATWGQKNSSLPASGLILVVDTANAINTYEVTSATATTITVKGGIDPAATGSSFGLIYGQMIKKTIATTQGGREVKFFNPKRPGGGYTDSNSPATGICQVCHVGTGYWTSDGGNTGHNSGVNCTDCHTMAQGFKP